MKALSPTVAWLADSTFSAAILIGGLSLASSVGAPFWLVPVFLAPFAMYLHFRLEPRGHGFSWFVGLSLLVLFFVAVERLLPASSKGQIPLIIFTWFAVSRCWRLRRVEGAG